MSTPIPPLQQALLALVPADGSSIGNTALRKAPGVPEADYRAAQAAADTRLQAAGRGDTDHIRTLRFSAPRPSRERGWGEGEINHVFTCDRYDSVRRTHHPGTGCTMRPTYIPKRAAGGWRLSGRVVAKIVDDRGIESLKVMMLGA